MHIIPNWEFCLLVLYYFVPLWILKESGGEIKLGLIFFYKLLNNVTVIYRTDLVVRVNINGLTNAILLRTSTTLATAPKENGPEPRSVISIPSSPPKSSSSSNNHYKRHHNLHHHHHHNQHQDHHIDQYDQYDHYHHHHHHHPQVDSLHERLESVSGVLKEIGPVWKNEFISLFSFLPW